MPVYTKSGSHCLLRGWAVIQETLFRYHYIWQWTLFSVLVDVSPQLAVVSIVFYFPLVLKDATTTLDGCTFNTFILAVLDATGGLLVAFTMKSTNAITKTFAISSSVIFTAIFGYLFLGFPLDVPIEIGETCAMLTVVNFGDNGSDSRGGEGKHEGTAIIPPGTEATWCGIQRR